jgi:hypothetical protein
MIFSDHMVLPMVPTTLETLYSYPMGHHSYSIKSKDGQKRLKNMFFTMLIFVNFYSAHKYGHGPLSGVQLSYGIT